MYRIMLADDEGIVISALSLIIEKNFKDLCILESAKTGRHVIELAERFRPDIAFMDIQMPGINGIEAIKEIKKISPSTIFIILSAYNKFDYAKEAINLGVIEYLNKPVNQKIIVEVIKKAMNLVDEEKRKRSHELLIKEKLEIVVPIIESGTIYAILFQEENECNLARYNELLDIKAEYGYMMVLEYGDSLEENNLSNAVGSSIKAQTFSYTIREIIKEHFECVVGANMINKIVVFVPHQASKIEYQERIGIIEKSRQMLNILEERIESTFRLGIGSVKSSTQLVDSYREAIKAMKNSRAKVIHFRDLPSNSFDEINYPLEVEQVLLGAIKLGKLQEVRSETEVYFDWIMRNYKECENDIKIKILELVLYSERKTFLNKGMAYGFTERRTYLEELMAIQNAIELKKWFIYKITEACNKVVIQKRDHSNECIQRAKDYIKANYYKDISLEDVSREVDISPYYFSKLFKEVTGENFIDYLTKLRIETAKLLLIRGKTIKETGIEVGYSDPNYFSRIFKKTIGITPTEYKEANA